MPIELSQLLDGLDDAQKETVTKTIEDNAKKLRAKVFIDGAGSHFVPKERLDKLAEERDAVKGQLDDLLPKLEDNEQAKATISGLQEKLKASQELSHKLAVESFLASEAKDTIAPVSDLLAFVDASKVTISEGGQVTGLKDQLDNLRQSKPYLFKSAEGGEQKGSGAGTGKVGNPTGFGNGNAPREVGSIGKQLAERAAKANEAHGQSSFFK